MLRGGIRPLNCAEVLDLGRRHEIRVAPITVTPRSSGITLNVGDNIFESATPTSVCVEGGYEPSRVRTFILLVSMNMFLNVTAK